MSLAFFLCVLLSFDLTPLTLAGPQPSVYLSSYLSALIPTCAQSCLEDFVATTFPAAICPDQQDISCLCTSGSTSGFTIGEGALRCVASACTNPQSSDFTAAYDACAGIPKSLPMTHGTLTATMASPSTVILDNGKPVSATPGEGSSPSASASVSSTISPSDTTTTSPLSLITATGSPSILSGSPILFTNSGTTIVMNTFTTLQSSSPSFTAAAASSTAGPQPVLTTAQIAGVAVAGSATAAVALGLLFFLFCVKRKHDSNNKRHSGSSFGADEVMGTLHELPSDPSIAPRALEAGKVLGKVPSKPQQQYLGVPVMYNDRTWGTSRQSLYSPEIGVAITPENITHEVSPISATSYRTTSNLLPDKPNYNLFPAPSHSQPPVRPERPAIRQVENPELRLIPPVPPGKPIRQTWRPMDTSQAALQPYPPQRNRVPSDPFKDTPSDPREMMYALERKRASRAQLPRIITPVSQQAQRSSWGTQPGPLYPPPPKRDIFKAAFPPKPVHQYPSQLRPISEVSNLASNPVRPQLPAFDSSSSSNSSTQAQLFKSTPYRSKSGGRRPLTHYTSASDTSFEDDGDDEEEMPLPPLVGLSPVQESPETRNRTPLSQIKYPVIHASSPPPRRLSPETPTRQPPARLQPQLVPIQISTLSPSRLQPQLVAVPKSFPSPIRLQPQLVAVTKPSPSPERVAAADKYLPAKPPRLSKTEFVPGSRQGQLHPVELEATPPPLSHLNSNAPRSAKWQILCSPGLERLENSASPRTVRNVRSDERTPQTGMLGTPRTVRAVKTDDRTPRTGDDSPHIWG